MKLNKLTLAIALAMAIPTASQAGPFTMNTTAVGGTNIFEFSSIVVSTSTPSVITLTDTNGSGVVDPFFADTFSETGAVFAANFKNKPGAIEINVNPLVSGVNINYELWAVYTPPYGGLGGAGALIGGNFVAAFSPLSSISLVYDTNIDGFFTAAGSTVVGFGTAASGNCVLPQFGQAQGTCDVDFLFTALPGVFSTTGNGADFNTYSKVFLNTDFNIDEINPGFTAAYAGGPGSTQIVSTTHDGSARFTVPEPASLALFGIGLLGLGAARRRKAA